MWVKQRHKPPMTSWEWFIYNPPIGPIKMVMTGVWITSDPNPWAKMAILPALVTLIFPSNLH